MSGCHSGYRPTVTPEKPTTPGAPITAADEQTPRIPKSLPQAFKQVKKALGARGGGLRLVDPEQQRKRGMLLRTLVKVFIVVATVASIAAALDVPKGRMKAKDRRALERAEAQRKRDENNPLVDSIEKAKQQDQHTLNRIKSRADVNNRPDSPTTPTKRTTDSTDKQARFEEMNRAKKRSDSRRTPE